MAKIATFEELKVWQNARVLSKDIFSVTQTIAFSKDFSLKDQINRSSASIMDNIAEGFERGGNKELIQFLFIAKGSAGEVRSQLYQALDRNYINAETHSSLKEKALELSKQLSGFINYLKRSELKGEKYHIKEPMEDYSTDFEF